MKYDLRRIAERLEVNPEPRPDIAICSECGWRGPAEGCWQDEEGDWETGYYTIDMCPKCEDGGCVDDYDMSPERVNEWWKWETKKMGKIDALLVKDLREQTGLGMMGCKKALEETDGDLDKAKELLGKRGAPARTIGRKTAEGTIGHYVHHDGRIGVLVELLCETDFTARNEEFKQLAAAIAMHVAASGPKYVDRDAVDSETVDAESEYYRKKFLDEGKPEKIVDKIVLGQMKKFYAENCLIDQVWFKAEKKETVGDVVKAMVAKVGENIKVASFRRIDLGENDSGEDQ